MPERTRPESDRQKPQTSPLPHETGAPFDAQQMNRPDVSNRTIHPIRQRLRKRQDHLAPGPRNQQLPFCPRIGCPPFPYPLDKCIQRGFRKKAPRHPRIGIASVHQYTIQPRPFLTCRGSKYPCIAKPTRWNIRRSSPHPIKTHDVPITVLETEERNPDPGPAPERYAPTLGPIRALHPLVQEKENVGALPSTRRIVIPNPNHRIGFLSLNAFLSTSMSSIGFRVINIIRDQSTTPRPKHLYRQRKPNTSHQGKPRIKSVAVLRFGNRHHDKQKHNNQRARYST